MHWDNIKSALDGLGIEYYTWADEDGEMVLFDGICGIKFELPNGDEFSIISHKFSYGGTKGLFEVMISEFEEPDGYLTEEEVLDKIYEVLI